MNGGGWFADLSAEEQGQARDALRKCAELPYILELQTSDGLNVIAHADYPAKEYSWQKEVDCESVLWRRERLNQLLCGKGEPIAGADDFWFGHTPLKTRFDAHNQHYIDTGAVFGGELTLVQLQ